MRTTKQLIDVLRQLAIIAPDRETRRNADRAAEALFRGVVAASSAIEISPDAAAVTSTTDEADGDDPQG